MPRISGRLASLVALVMLLAAIPQLAPLTSSTTAWANGESWSLVDATVAIEWRSVATDGNGVWVAVSQTNQAMRSTDNGATWSPLGPAEGIANNGWVSVAYGNGVWVAVAFSGTNRVMRSETNGATWSALASADDDVFWRSVATDGNGVWVAVADSQAMRSPDNGETWTLLGSDVGVEANPWNSVAYGNGWWVAVSSNGTNRVMRSTDGQNWIPTPGVGIYLWNAVATDGNGVWVAVANNRVMRSTDDGALWSSLGSDAGVEANNWRSVAYGNGVWVAISSNGTNRVMRSTDDGASWSSLGSEAGVEASIWRSVDYGNGVWVAVADGANRVMRSLDPVDPGSPSPPLVSSTPSAASAGVPGVYLYIAGSPGRLVEGTPVYHGSAGIAPNTPYALSLQSMGARALTRTVLATGVTNGRGHVERRIELGALARGSYKIVMTGSHALGYPLVLTNHISVDGAGKFVSVSAESQQPFLN